MVNREMLKIIPFGIIPNGIKIFINNKVGFISDIMEKCIIMEIKCV
jgi:hypothetical protein